MGFRIKRHGWRRWAFGLGPWLCLAFALSASPIHAQPADGAVKFHILGDAEAPAESRKVGKAPKCSGDDQATFELAARRAIGNTQKTLMRLDRSDEAAVKLFERYFGPDTPERRQAVRKVLSDSLAYLNDASKPLYIFCRVKNQLGEPCTDHVRAARWGGKKIPGLQSQPPADAEVLVLCRQFFDASHERQFTDWGTVLHEATHIAADTDDWRYRKSDVEALAIDDPELAISNADSYRQYAEDMVFLPN